MERRTIIALVLVIVVIVITPRLFPSARTRGGGPTPARVPVTTGDTSSESRTKPAVTAPAVTAVRADSTMASGLVKPESVSVADSLSRVVYSTGGGSISHVELSTYQALDQRAGSVSLNAGREPLLSFRLVTGADTIRLQDHVLTARQIVDPKGHETVVFTGMAGSHTVAIQYNAVPDSFLTRVSGTIQAPAGTPAGASYLLVDMPRTLTSYEADSGADHGSLAYAIRVAEKSPQGISFRSLDPGERQLVAGPITWAATKNKYFIVAVLADSGSQQFVEAQVTGGPRVSRTATQAAGTLVGRLAADGRFAFDVYAGPQQYQRLRSMGRDFENSNPYGGWLQGVVQPFATIVMRILLWMKASLGWSYGALLVLFGVAVRLLMWPLNQGAMRTTMKMQRIQPELNAIQQKYKGDPQRLQTEMMRVYKDHNMSPFSAFAGCLPILLPMPVLFALFFVFQNTIEFRGVPFLWLTDISLKDPYYIVPLLMGASMFVLSWIGLRNSPPNPQAKMMAYVMPVMMTVLFANFASGLNLYYAVQNVAALPQQWLIAHERAKAKG